MKHVILDLDGTVYRGTESVSGVPQTIESLHDSGIQTTFLTNNATLSREEFVSKLYQMGIYAEPDEIFTSGTITARYLSAKFSSESVFAIGETAFYTALQEAGLEVTTDPESSDIVVVALDRDFDYETLSEALIALEKDQIPYFATNSDPTRPGENHPLPSTGSILGAIQVSADREPDQILGKPSKIAANIIQEKREIEPSEAIVVGDRLTTDIKFGKRMGTKTALVKSGGDRSYSKAVPDGPDYVLESLAKVEQII